MQVKPSRSAWSLEEGHRDPQREMATAQADSFHRQLDSPRSAKRSASIFYLQNTSPIILRLYLPTTIARQVFAMAAK